MNPLRLHPDDARSWALWPTLEKRLRDFCLIYAQDTPYEPMLAHVRRLFATTPDLLGAWVVLDDADETSILAHCLSWVDVYWGEPYILIHQLRGDKPQRWSTYKRHMLHELFMWARALNEQYQASGSLHRIRQFRFLTERPDEWQAYLRTQAHRSLTMFTIPVEV